MRRLLTAGAAAAAVLTLGAIALDRDSARAELLPDLKQVRPAAISVTEVRGEHRLVFLSAVENVGEGAIVIEGRRATRADESMAVEQVVRRSDGSARSYALDAELRYVASETHAHWHLLGFERYELRRAGDGTLVAPDRKTGFCLGDRFDASPRDLLNEPPHAVWTQECGLRSPGLLVVREGISPGYGDDYVPTLESQYVVLDGVPAGRYRLVHTVNPEGVLRESDYSNNAASALLELTWRDGVPTVEVLNQREPATRCRCRAGKPSREEAMRPTLTVFLLALVTAAALSTGALAKEGGVELGSAPIGKEPGEPWFTTLKLIDIDGRLPENAKPGITIKSLDTGRQADYPAKPTDKPGLYRVRVVFPEAGTWIYSAYDGVTGRMYEYPAVEITEPPAAATKPPAATAKAPSSAEGGFPVWPLVGGLAALALASAGATFALRRHRLRLSH